MVSSKFGALIGTLFLARDVAHREHLNTGSYAQHMALGDFYEGIVGLADQLAEAYQGIFNTTVDIPLLSHNDGDSIIDTLAAQLDYIHESRYGAVPREWTSLQNVVDEVELIYAQTLYKLRRLK